MMRTTLQIYLAAEVAVSFTHALAHLTRLWGCNRSRAVIQAVLRVAREEGWADPRKENRNVWLRSFP